MAIVATFTRIVQRVSPQGPVVDMRSAIIVMGRADVGSATVQHCIYQLIIVFRNVYVEVA